MAATDQTYRNQRTLDIVFAVSCILMLVSIVVMFAQDYYREFKKVQREFRDVDEALAMRALLEKLPETEKVKAAGGKVAELREKIKQIKAENRSKFSKLFAERAIAEAKYQQIKADLDSYVSLLNIEVDKLGEVEDAGIVQSIQKSIDEWRRKVTEKQKELIAAELQMQGKFREMAEIETEQKKVEDDLAKAENDLKLLGGEFDRFAKAAALKRWKIGDAVRNLPVIDGFAAPIKIQQYTLSEYPIDYSFKYVTRYDRCTTCHLGMETPAFDKGALAKLTPDNMPEGLQAKLDETIKLFKERKAAGEELGFDIGDLPSKVPTLKLTESQVNEYCVHPRLDLFVDANSPHKAEKFGCTSCHQGQGSATDFLLASHSPNTADSQRKWEDGYNWKSNHYWDYPMLPNRFIESTCLKCHHQVTDLIRYGNKEEAPKLIRGYNIVRESGCFGCHEISGRKSGKQIGPDLRLELSPPLESWPPAERAKILADTENPPGTMRKLGPSLYRLVEKTNPEWTRKWIDTPRGFRPTTKMPHFYGLSNNARDALPDDQKDFPVAEMHSIVHYLFRESGDYLEGKDKERRDIAVRIAQLQEKKETKLISDKENKELEELLLKTSRYEKPIPIAARARDWEGNAIQLAAAPADPKAAAEQIKRGNMLFKERGCLACHTHEGTTKPESDVPAVTSDAEFAPDLTRLAAKIAPVVGGADAKRLWLVQWILDPKVHHPRTRMPFTYLNTSEASDVAAWLLSQDPQWTQADLPVPTAQALTELAKVYLLKAPGLMRKDVEEALVQEGNTWKGLPADRLKFMSADADERELAGPVDENKIKWYIGRKAITRLGCYACHDIPGFAAAKPIGTPLNDWGKKDAERLAFEDIGAYVRGHYQVVDSMKDENGHGPKVEAGKQPYDKFFFLALEHHQREGFLHQKLNEPRSYDHNRLRTWDDRLRMPQFKFARGHIKPLPGESKEQAEAREEAEAREAVMTFILGLVAEPVPESYLHRPSADKAAEVRGRHVLEKYNCGGCHQVRPGTYEFKKSAKLVEKLEDLAYQKNPKNYAAEYRDRFTAQSEWTGNASPFTDRLQAFGVPDQATPTNLRLTQALRFTKKPEEVRNRGDNTELPDGNYDIPASTYLDTQDLGGVKASDPYGGAFAQLMTSYLKAKNSTTYNEYKTARSALPPPLLREGEKVQPSWLFQFLLHPQQVRPATILRMPRFNMSEDEAMALVNYFAAADKLSNPGEGLTYPYLGIAQREGAFWTERAQQYLDRLQKEGVLVTRVQGMQPAWEQILDARIAEQKVVVEQSKASVASAKDPAGRKDAETLLASRQKTLDELQNEAKQKKGPFLDAERQQWMASEIYATDAYRMLGNYNTPCLGCHQVGSMLAKNPKHEQGPALDLTWERLRPEWTLRWIANPDRLLSYPTPMPQNFPRDKVDAKGFSANYPEFLGKPEHQVMAIRDILMNLPKVADMPENRLHRPTMEAK